MSEQQVDLRKPIEAIWTGQQRFRYFVSAVLLPLVAITCAYVAFKTYARLGVLTDVGITIAILTGWNETEYWIAIMVHLFTSAAMIKCCLSTKMAAPWYVRKTIWIAVVLWVIAAGVAIIKFGPLSIGAAIIASTLLAAFALMCAVLIPTYADSNRHNQSGGRFTILQLMFLTTVVAIVAAIGMQFSQTASLELWVVGKLVDALFRLFLLACPILACYAYFRAAIDFSPLVRRFRGQ